MQQHCFWKVRTYRWISHQKRQFHSIQDRKTQKLDRCRFSYQEQHRQQELSILMYLFATNFQITQSVTVVSSYPATATRGRIQTRKTISWIQVSTLFKATSSESKPMKLSSFSQTKPSKTSASNYPLSWMKTNGTKPVSVSTLLLQAIRLPSFDLCVFFVNTLLSIDRD